MYSYTPTYSLSKKTSEMMAFSFINELNAKVHTIRAKALVIRAKALVMSAKALVISAKALVMSAKALVMSAKAQMPFFLAHSIPKSFITSNTKGIK